MHSSWTQECENERHLLTTGKEDERAGLLSNSLVWIQYYCLHSFSGHKMFIINFVFEAVNLLTLPPPVYSQQSHWGSTVSDSTPYAWLRGLHIPLNYFQRNKAIKFLILSLKHISNLFTMRPPWRTGLKPFTRSWSWAPSALVMQS